MFFKSPVQLFSQQVVMNKCFLNPEKKLVQIRTVVIRKKKQRKTRSTSTHSQFHKNDFTVLKPTLTTSKGQFQQPFANIIVQK